MKTITDEQFEKYEYALHATESRESVNLILEKITLGLDPEYIMGGIGDVWTMKEVKLPKEGGILSYFNEHVYPKKGFPVERVVERINIIKKVAVAILYGLSKSKIILAITVLCFRKDLVIAYKELTTKLSDLIGYTALNPSRYCISVRELYRAFEEEDSSLRTIVCMVLESDDAYRYRFQDIVGELNKENFAKNPLKELDRLIVLIEFRDTDDRLREMYKKARKALFILFFSGYFREKVLNLLSRLNIENIRMQEDDLYFARLKKGGYLYRWGEYDSSVS